MIDEIRRIQAESTRRIDGAATLDELGELQRDLFGKASELGGLKKQLGGLAPEARREAGLAMNEATEALRKSMGRDELLKEAAE